MFFFDVSANHTVNAVNKTHTSVLQLSRFLPLGRGMLSIVSFPALVDCSYSHQRGSFVDCVLITLSSRKIFAYELTSKSSGSYFILTFLYALRKSVLNHSEVAFNCFLSMKLLKTILKNECLRNGKGDEEFCTW